MSSVLENTVEMPANTEAKKEEQKDCPVCMDHFTTVIRQRITCAYCPHTVCRQCASRFLLTTLNDPHCMGCKREWNREFIDTNLTQTFRKGPLKLQRRKVLIDREKGRLPAMQVFMEAKVGMDQANKRSQELWMRKRQLKKQKTRIHAEILAGGIMEADELNREIEEKLGPINTELATIRIEMTQCTDQVRRLWRIFHGQERVVREFIMKCPADECRGFLSSAWKCGTCQKHFCNDCHAEKSGQKDETHVCNEDAKSTAAMIQKETKPCPKCGIRISKIDGCFAKDTPVLLWNGTLKMSQDIIVGDVLVGDDGLSRVVENLCSGGDEMYEVYQGKGMSYVVNSKHKLALKFSGDKNIYWSPKKNGWVMRWFDRCEHVMKYKNSLVSSEISKEEAYTILDAFRETLVFDDIIEITVSDYMKLSKSILKEMMGFKSSGVNWSKKDVPLDPYLLGLWLGDGINDGMSFAVSSETDPEIISYLLEWCNNNNSELIHDEAYRFRIRRREVSHGRLAIGRGATSSDCKGCKLKKCSFCDLPNVAYTSDVIDTNKNTLKEALDMYDLPRKPKCIPSDYLINDRNNRLQLLAGLIDTDGYVGNDGKRIQLPQANHKLARQIEFLARSLGFIVNIDILKKTNISFGGSEAKDYGDQMRVNISGENLADIPTRVARKKCVSSSANKDQLRTHISVKSIGQGTYYGWSVSSNKRFLLGDFTVVRNCDQMWCTECQTTFSWNTGQILLNTVTHNPHYYEYLRRVNNGQIPREAGDVPCGGLPNAYLFIRFIMDQQNVVLGEETKREIMLVHRCMSDIENYRLAQYPLRQPANVNRDLDISFLMNDIDEEKWGTSLERQETNFERRKEIGLIIQTLLHVGAEKLSALYNAATNSKEKRRRLFAEVLPEMNKVREFTNKSLWTKGRQMGMVVPQISDRWDWMMARKSDIKNNAEPVVPNQNEIVEPEPEEETHPAQPNPIVTHHDNSDDEFVDNTPAVVIQEPVANAGAGQPQGMDTTDDMVYVEIDGEMVEMTRRQMRMLLE